MTDSEHSLARNDRSFGTALDGCAGEAHAMRLNSQTRIPL